MKVSCLFKIFVIPKAVLFVESFICISSLAGKVKKKFKISILFKADAYWIGVQDILEPNENSSSSR